MDGYAVIAADTETAARAMPAELQLLDRIYTGKPSTVTVTRGTCAEIATGAPLPEGADAVVMVEETAKAADGRIQILAKAARGQKALASPRAVADGADLAVGVGEGRHMGDCPRRGFRGIG